MAVSVNATGTKLYTGTAGTSINYTGLTVASGSNTGIVGLLFVDSSTNISGITATWDSGGAAQVMTQIITKDNGSGANAVYIFGLAGEHGPVSTGNKTLNVSWTGSQRTFFVAMAFDDVYQAGGSFSFSDGTSANSVATIAVPTGVGNAVIALESAGTSQGTSTGTLIFDDHTGGAVINAMCQYAAGAAGTVSIGNSGTNASIAGCNILSTAGFVPGTGTSAAGGGSKQRGALRAFSQGLDNLHLGQTPRGPVKIDWSQAPRGLKVFFLNNTPSFPDLVGAGGVPQYNPTTPPSMGMTPTGPAFDPAVGIQPNGGAVQIGGVGPPNFSIELYIYYDTAETGNGYCRVSETTYINGTEDRWIAIDATGHPLIHTTAGTTTSPTALTLGKLYHLVATNDGSTQSIYINGALAASSGVSSGGYNGFTTPVFGQGYGADGTPKNKIIHCALSFAAWTADEVAQRYADPYAFLVPAEGEMPALKTPAGAAAPPFIPNSNDNFNVRQLATRAAAAILCATQATTFAVPPSATPTPKQFGWYQQLSKPAPVAQAKPGSAFVPFNTAQVAQTVVKGWYGQTSTTVRVRTAQPTQPTSFAVPASVAPPAQTPGQFGWWAQLSKSAPIAQAKPGNAFVPFNTAQVVISPQTVPLNYDAGSVQQRVVYYQSSFQVLRPPVAAPSNTITGIAWHQPLSAVVKGASANPTLPTQFATPYQNTIVGIGWHRWLDPINGGVKNATPQLTQPFVPFNTVQIVTVQKSGWYQPLSRPAPVAQAQQGNTSLPLNTRQVNSITGIGWYQNLSRPAPVAIAQAGFSFVPFNTKQIVTVQVAFDPFVKKRSKPKRDRLRDELEIKYKRRLAIEEAFWPPTIYELPPYKLPEHVKPAPDVSDLANVILQVQQMRAAQAKQQDEEDENALLELLKREYGIEDV